MTQTLEPTRNSYTEEDRTRGLTVLAWCSGNSRLASKRLKDAGHDIPWRTLHDWREKRPEAYERVREAILPQVEERVASEAEAMAIAAAQVEAEVLVHLQDNLKQLSPGEAASALRNLTTSKGINIDKALLLRGKPTQIVQRQDAHELLRQLAIDGTATEIGSDR